MTFSCIVLVHLSFFLHVLFLWLLCWRRSGVNSPRHGYKVRMRGPANCDCSYHAKSNNRQLSSIESDGDGDTEVSTAKEALETCVLAVSLFDWRDQRWSRFWSFEATSTN